MLIVASPLALFYREQPKYVERYIAGTADKFRQFIDDGLARLEAQGTPILTPRPSTGVSPMPRLDLGGQAGPGGGYGDAPSPGSARAETPQSQGRLSSLRERLSHIKASTEGAPAGMSGVSSSENLAAYGGAGPVPQTQPSVDELAARLQMLRRGNQ